MRDVPMAATLARAELSGVRLVITSDQVKKHCLDRAEHHQGRANWYREEASKIHGSVSAAQEMNEEDESRGLGNMYSKAAEPIRGLRDSARFHAGRAAWFKMVATYVDPGQKFVLPLQEATQLDLPESFR